MYILKDIKKQIKKYFILFVISLGSFCFFTYLYVDNVISFQETWNVLSKYQNINKDLYLNDYPPSHINEEQLKEYIWELKQVDVLEDSSLSDKLSNYIANIYVLIADFDSARQHFAFQNWEYYFNLANTYFFEWYLELLEWDDLQKSFENLSVAIQYYNDSAQVLWDPDDENATKIINNRVVAYWLRLIVAAKYCWEIFDNIISKFEDLFDYVNNLMERILQQNEDLQDWKDELNDQYLLDCIDSLIESNQHSYNNLLHINDLLERYRTWALDMLEEYIQQDPYSCAVESSNIKDKFNSAYENIISAMQSYTETYQVLDNLIASRDKETLRYFCEHADEIQEGMDEADQQMEDWLQELDEMFDPDGVEDYMQEPDRQHQDPYFDQDWQDLFEPEDEYRPHSDEQHHQELEEGMQEEMRERMRQQWAEWIEEMYELRWQPDYTPREYIERLFEQFEWSPEDFGDNW